MKTFNILIRVLVIHEYIYQNLLYVNYISIKKTLGKKSWGESSNSHQEKLKFK